MVFQLLLPLRNTSALDLNTGKYVWKVPLGETDSFEISVILQQDRKLQRQLSPKTDYSLLPLQRMVTSGHSTRKSEALWEFKLPAPAFATPAMYKVEGKQYLAIACGGEKMGTKKGNK